MKAKHFKKLRSKLIWYKVMTTYGLFGDFYGFGEIFKHDPIRVLAYSPEHACKRAKRRGIGLNKHIGSITKSSQFAHWQVREQGRPDTHHNTYYF